MKTKIRHIMLPAVFPALFVIFAAIPVDAMGCRNRGLAVALVALTGGLLGIGTAIKALVGKVRGQPEAPWWMASTLILAIPLVAVVIWAG